MDKSVTTITSRISSQFRHHTMQYITVHHNNNQKKFTSRIKVTNLSSVPIRVDPNLSSVLNMVGGAVKPSVPTRP